MPALFPLPCVPGARRGKGDSREVRKAIVECERRKAPFCHCPCACIHTLVPPTLSPGLFPFDFKREKPWEWACGSPAPVPFLAPAMWAIFFPMERTVNGLNWKKWNELQFATAVYITNYSVPMSFRWFLESFPQILSLIPCWLHPWNPRPWVSQDDIYSSTCSCRARVWICFGPDKHPFGSGEGNLCTVCAALAPHPWSEYRVLHEVVTEEGWCQVPGYQVALFNMATGGASGQSSATEEDATELQFPKGLNWSLTSTSSQGNVMFLSRG